MEWRGELDVIAVDDEVLFPGGQLTTVIFPGAVAEMQPQGPVLFVARRPGPTTRRGQGSLYRVGTIAELTVTRYPDGSAELAAHGLARAAVETFRGREPFLIARCRTLPDRPTLNDEEDSVALETAGLLERVGLFEPGELTFLKTRHPVDRAWALIDLVASGLMASVGDRQRLLETNDRLARLVHARDFARGFAVLRDGRPSGSGAGYLH